MRNGTPDVLMRCLARLIRCAIVASGTRNALAISAVVRPPTARSVSAIADGRVSAGWQHMKSRIERVVRSIDGALEVTARVGRRHEPVGRPRRTTAASRRRRASSAAQVIGHAPRGDLNQPAARVVRHALARPLQRGGEQRLLHRVFRGGEVAEAPDHGAEHLRRQLAQQVLAGEVAGAAVTRRRAAPLITWRTSIGMFIGLPPGPGAAEARAAIS